MSSTNLVESDVGTTLLCNVIMKSYCKYVVECTAIFVNVWLFISHYRSKPRTIFATTGRGWHTSYSKPGASRGPSATCWASRFLSASMIAALTRGDLSSSGAVFNWNRSGLCSRGRRGRGEKSTSTDISTNK